MHEMVLAVRSQAWHGRGLTMAQQLEAIAGHGFRVINLVLEVDTSAAELDEGVRAFQDLGLTMGQVGMDPNLYGATPGPDQWTRWIDGGRAKIELNVRLGGVQVAMLSGSTAPGYDQELAWADSVATMQQLCDEAAAVGQYVALKPKPDAHCVTRSYPQALAYHEQVGRDNLLLCPDTGHLCETGATHAQADRMGHLIPHCHITDVDGPIGQGEAPIADWLRYLKPWVEASAERIGCTPAAGLEFFGQDPDAEAERVIAHMCQAMPELGM